METYRLVGLHSNRGVLSIINPDFMATRGGKSTATKYFRAASAAHVQFVRRGSHGSRPSSHADASRSSSQARAGRVAGRGGAGRGGAGRGGAGRSKPALLSLQPRRASTHSISQMTSGAGGPDRRTIPSESEVGPAYQVVCSRWRYHSPCFLITSKLGNNVGIKLT